jgi:hypothetical protein
VRSIETAEQPGRARRPGAFCVKRRPEGAVVGDDEEACDAGRSGRSPRLIDQAQDEVIGGAPSRMADDQPGCDPLAAEAGVGRAIEHELDTDVSRDRATQPTDQRGRRNLTARPGERG